MFELDETQQLVENAARAWCEGELLPLIPALESGELLPYDSLRRLGRDLGISEALVTRVERRLAKLQAGEDASPRPRAEGTPSSFGGDPMFTSILLKEISRVSPGVAMVFISTLGCGMAILQRGSAAAIERCALPIFRFEKVGAWALTEPSAGSDAFGGMRSTAVPDGDEFVLNGQKAFISNAPCADVFSVYARVQTGGERNVVRGFVVEKGNPGLEAGPALRKMGLHDSPTGDVFLRDCRVPRENLIGSLETKNGRDPGREAMDTLSLERTVMPAMCLGIIERCVEESRSYAQTREQFGRPIGQFQGIAFKLARMELALENARNLVFKLAWAQREGKLDPRLASLAKLYCSEQAVQVSLDAIQIHGGSGYMADLPLEKLMRDAKVFEIAGGTTEIQLQTVSRAVLA